MDKYLDKMLVIRGGNCSLGVAGESKKGKTSYEKFNHSASPVRGKLKFER